MPSPTDFNLTPYYDDFTESKNFIEFFLDQTFAVQKARELTQSQTILQNQIENLSDHIFKQGAMVMGVISYDLNYYSVKLSAKSVSDLSKYNGVRLTGATSGCCKLCWCFKHRRNRPGHFICKIRNFRNK